jgi:hypothetical protein
LATSLCTAHITLCAFLPFSGLGSLRFPRGINIWDEIADSFPRGSPIRHPIPERMTYSVKEGRSHVALFLIIIKAQVAFVLLAN